MAMSPTDRTVAITISFRADQGSARAVWKSFARGLAGEGAGVFPGDRSEQGTTLRWVALVLSVSLCTIYDRTARRLRPRVLCADGGCGDELCPTKAERASNRFI